MLFGLSGIRVEAVVGADRDGCVTEAVGDVVVRVVHVATDWPSAGRCPVCEVLSTSLKQWRTTHPRDVEHGGPVVVAWRKAQWRCRNAGCERKAFTDSVPQVPPGARLTERLRERVGASVGAEVSVSGAARSHGVSWPVAQAAHAAHADAVLAAAAFEQERLARRAGVKSLVRVLGIDETRRGRPRWAQDPDTGKWRLGERFETNFVDLGDGHHLGPVPLLGQTAGRTVTAVTGWLDAHGQAWKDRIDVVAIDLSATYLAAVRQALPDATVVADHFHVQRLGNQMLTRVRQRVTREQTGRRGLAADPVWAGRRRLLRAYERLTDAQFTRMWNDLIDNDPTDQILSAWIVKEQLRRLLACAKTGPNRTDISHRLYDFYRWADSSGLPEAVSLAQTVEKWWPQILAFIQTGISNAGTESTNRQIKTQGRIARGFRNIDNQRRRVRYACLPSPRAGHRQSRALPL